MDTTTLDGGFTDPVLEAQHNFRAIMDALANPGTIQPLPQGLTPPAPLGAELAAILLTLADHDTPIWLEAALATPAVLGWLRFHTGAPLGGAQDAAAFAVMTDGTTLELGGFATGTDLYPDRSTTVIVALEALDGGVPLQLAGPGIETSRTIAPLGLPVDFVEQWAENGALFPRGVDLLLTGPGAVLGLPRTTRITRKDG